MGVTLAQVFHTFGAAYLETHALSAPQAKVVRAIVQCRTAALGGHIRECDQCGHQEFVYHSCRNRHCPTCQSRAKELWTRQRLQELLPVPYAHLVFTLPHALNGLAAYHAPWLYDTLLNSVAQTLSAFAQNPRWLGAEPAITLVLHTWTQELRRHLHVHAVISCGGLDPIGQWITPHRQPRFLFPVHALSRVFRATFLAALATAHRAGMLSRDPDNAPDRYAARQKTLWQHAWVVYAKIPLGGAPEVLAYLARYTHRTAISNERLLTIQNGEVVFRVRADPPGGKRVITLNGMTFIGRFLQHVLPPGLKRIRHYGLLAARHKRVRLAEARQALAVPPPVPIAQEAAAQFMRRVARCEIERCPRCQQGRLRTVAKLLPERRDTGKGVYTRRVPHNRGPPE